MKKIKWVKVGKGVSWVISKPALTDSGKPVDHREKRKKVNREQVDKLKGNSMRDFVRRKK